MAETLRISIPIETIDNTDPELSNISIKFEKMGKAADGANSSAKKANTTVSQFDKQAQKTERSLASWAKEKYEIMLEAKDKIAPVLSTLGNGLKSFAGKTWSVTMRAVDFITSPVRGIINLLKNPVFQVGAVLGVSIGLKDTVETYKNFEAAMSQVQAISGATGSELTKLTSKAKEMGASTKFTAQESAEAFNYMAMAGWKTDDMLNGIEGILSLAAASGEDLATTSDIVTDALTAFNMKASDAGRFSDVLAMAASNANTTVSGMGETFKYAGAMAGALGYSIEDVALMTGLMANAGIKGTMSGTALNSIFTRLSTNTNGAADALADLGIKFFTSEGNARDLSDVMGELRNATANMSQEQKAQLANTIAGTEAQKGLVAILNASEEDYNKLAEAINNADGAAASMSDTMMDNLAGSITLLQSAADGVKISFGERLSPYVRNLAEWLTAQMPAIEQGLEEFMDWVDKKVDRIQRKYEEISSTQEWQDANFFGKVKIAWDEFIAEPFSEWWNGIGKAKFAGFAQDIGKGIGTGLKFGVMTMLGIDIEETLDEGISIGASFAKGFSEGFDFDAVSEKLWQGFKNLISSAGKLLPGGESADLSSILSAVMLSKIATPFIGIGKGALSIGKGAASIGKGLFATNAETGTSIMSSFLGATGNAMVGGSGLLGKLANTGYALTGGAATSSLSGGAAALAGGGALAGGVAAGATLISGALDAYKAFKSENSDESAAYGESATWKAGGVAVGAAAGAALGSVIPGIGTAVGALVGAGVGGIAGWIKGNKVKEEYEQNVAEMQKKAERAQKIFEATGLSIKDVTFKSEALTQAMNDTQVSTSQFALMFQEECAKVMTEAFGDIHLSLTEVKKLASEITFADKAETLEDFAGAAANTQTSLSNLQKNVSTLRKENWKVSLGMELSELEKDNYKASIDNFVTAAKTYIEDNHYEATVALKLLLGDDADVTGLNSLYEGFNSQIDEYSKNLSDEIQKAFEDGIIGVDEMAIIEEYQQKITDITNKLSEARSEAKLQAIGIKYSGAELDAESYQAMQEELIEYSKQAQEQYDDALNATLTNLELQKKAGIITKAEYNAKVEEANRNYHEQINGISVRVNNFNLDAVAKAYEDELKGLMPFFEGTTQEKLQQAINNAMIAHPDTDSWEAADVIKWLGLDKLNIDTAEQTVIADALIQSAKANTGKTKEALIESYKECIPTSKEIFASIDWREFTVNDYENLMRIVDPTFIVNPDLDIDFEQKQKTYKEIFGDDWTTAAMDIADEIVQAMEKNLDPQALQTVIDNYFNGSSEELLNAASLYRDSAQAAIDTAFADPFSVSAEIQINPVFSGMPYLYPSEYASPYKEYTPTSSGSGGSFSGRPVNNAAGGYVSGGPLISWLAEEGYGEFVIPTNPSRRARALELYQQAGIALGVSAHAAGGYVGGSILSNTAADYNFLNRSIKEAPRAYYESTEGNYDDEQYESVQSERESSVGSVEIQVSVSMAPEFVIQADNQSEDNTMQVIRRHFREIADELGGEIAGKLEEVFSNMPICR